MKQDAAKNTAQSTAQSTARTGTAHAVHAFLRRKGWVAGLDPDPEKAVRFLAAGEYNENYLVFGNRQNQRQDNRQDTGPDTRQEYVLRINHGSQLGQSDQIGYEFQVLELLKDSGVTPRALFVEPEPDNARLGRGVLLMEFLPGQPLDYRTDTPTAARIFARVHGVRVPPDHGLVVQADPVGDIVRESQGLLARFIDHPLKAERKRLLQLRDEVLELRDATRGLFAQDSLVIVNTEVNSHNFLIPPHGQATNDTGGWLIDWEKSVVSTRFQDLAHFTVATTTRWKRGYTYSDEQKHGFLKAYMNAVPDFSMDADSAWQRLMVLERTILLRALSWCHMAYYEYTRADRALKNQDTFDRIREYMEGMEWLLK